VKQAFRRLVGELPKKVSAQKHACSKIFLLVKTPTRAKRFLQN
jgi:hypothetical protein